jgi:hypothetical protein
MPGGNAENECDSRSLQAQAASSAHFAIDTPAANGHALHDSGESMAETQQEKAQPDKAPQDKRATRRFGLRLPVAVATAENGAHAIEAQTRDVSARGICFFIESAIAAGSGIEFTLTLPPEITLTEAIRVRCTGKVVRVEEEKEGKVAVAAIIDEYEFLAEP